MPMKVYIQVKKLGKRMQTVGSIPYELETCPATLRELIVCMVNQGVERYNERLRSGEQNKALSEAEIQDMSQVGKIAFGRRKTEKIDGKRNEFHIVKQAEYPVYQGIHDAIVSKDIWDAAQAFTDGLYRFFVGEQEITELDALLQLCEGDTIAIIRLTMLTGGLF